MTSGRDMVVPPVVDLAVPAGMVRVTGGTYMMGNTTATDPDANSDEMPIHSVTVPTFYLDRTEVKVAEYKACNDPGCTAPDTSMNCNWNVGGKDNHPINCVDWNQASAYCKWGGKRLPTEEEWEYAARGTMHSKYPWGNGAPEVPGMGGTQLCWDRANVACADGGTCSYGTCEVGSYPDALLGREVAAQTGLVDMAGNVWEWTSTKFCSNYSGTNCTSNYIIRGGSWYDGTASVVRAAGRNDYDATNRSRNIGFRCARSAP